jgi:predicted lactoylglutathione lyase
MKPRISIITLAVENLQRSLIFYSDGLGFPTRGIVEGFEDHVLFDLQDGLSLVLFLRTEIEKLAEQHHGNKSSSECILSYAASSKEEVDEILANAIVAGATPCGKPEQQPWGYFCYFKDPDGHLWEIITAPATQ